MKRHPYEKSYVMSLILNIASDASVLPALGTDITRWELMRSADVESTRTMACVLYDSWAPAVFVICKLPPGT